MVESSSVVLSSAAAAFLSEAPVCKSAEALDEHFLRFARALGFDSAMFVHLSSAGAPIAPRVVFGDSAPWVERYTAQNYARLDPTIPMAFRSRRAFTWKDAERRGGSRQERQFFGEARELWAKDGLIVPVHGPFGEFSVVNLLCTQKIALTEEEMAVLKGVCSVYAAVGLNFAQGALPPPVTAAPPLSRRERQCLYWMCMGKHDGETAIILGIKASTVRTYLDSAKVKLDAMSRPELSLKALACGVLVPDRAMMA